MENEKKLYQALVLVNKSAKIHRRVSLFAKNINEAMEILESEYGVGNVFNLYNEEDADRSR